MNRIRHLYMKYMYGYQSQKTARQYYKLKAEKGI